MTLRLGGVSGIQNNTQVPKRKRSPQGRKGAEPGRVLGGSSLVLRRIQWVRWSAVYMQSSTRPSHATSSSERSSLNCITRESTTIQSSTLSRSSNCKFHTCPLFSGLPRSCVRGAVTRLWSDTLISPIPSSCRLHPTPRLSSKAHAACIPSSNGR